MSGQAKSWARFSRAALGPLVLAAAMPALAGETQWNFTVLLDGQAIGEHRFTVSTAGAQTQVTSKADFVVRLFGIPVYHYRHEDKEQWQDNCLTGLTASTHDGGTTSQVHAAEAPGGLALTVGGAPAQTLSGCVMSFAYWTPRIQTQTRLLNAQTGVYQAVQVSALGLGTLEVRGQPVNATHWRITGPEQPVDLWYSPQGEWLGLDARVAGHRQLSYRLR